MKSTAAQCTATNSSGKDLGTTAVYTGRVGIGEIWRESNSKSTSINQKQRAGAWEVDEWESPEKLTLAKGSLKR
jgi:hypothetical protein